MKNNYEQSNDFVIGQKVKVSLKDGSFSEHKIINIIDSKKAVIAIGLNYDIKNPVKVIILDENIKSNAGAYHPELDVIFAYNDTKPEIMHHEIIHSLEMKKIIPKELKVFYEKILEIFPDNSNLEPNFRKDIHEFIADAYSKDGLIETLKKQNLYEEFKKLTEYIFE